jgi:hypothetical protein
MDSPRISGGSSSPNAGYTISLAGVVCKEPVVIVGDRDDGGGLISGRSSGEDMGWGREREGLVGGKVTCVENWLGVMGSEDQRAIRPDERPVWMLE